MRNRMQYVVVAGACVYIVFACGAFLLMLGLAVVGFVEIGKGILAFFVSDDTEIGGRVAVSLALKGLEMLFLAPLPFMVVFAVGGYLRALGASEAGGERSDERKIGRLERTKSLLISLMVAVMAADLVSKTLSNDGLTPEAAIYESIVIAVLGGYFLLRERVL
jgi:hypothetical protein